MNLEDLFTVSALTASINKLPVLPTRVASMGLFEERGVPTTTVTIDVRNGRLFLVPNTSRNDNPAPIKNSKRTRRTFECAHLPTEGHVLPSEVQNVAAFTPDAADGSTTNPLQGQAEVINDKLLTMKNSLEATREFQRVGALRGQILDADGSVLHDLYDEFGVTKKRIIVPFTKADADIRKFCMDAKRYAEPKLGGVLVRGFKAFCGANWFDAFTNHPNVIRAYANYQEAADRLGGDVRKGFVFGGIEFSEYTVTVSGQPFIPADVAQVFPDAAGAYALYNAPANYNETVNTLGQPFYAKAQERRMGKGWDLEGQANPLPLSLYPEALVEMPMG